MVEIKNPGNISKLTNTAGVPGSGITDEIDHMHTGLIKTLSRQSIGNYAVRRGAVSSDAGFKMTQTDNGSGKTQIVVSQGRIIRDGKQYDVAAKTFVAGTTPSTFDQPTSGVSYFLLVADSAGTPLLQIRGDKTVTGLVPDYTSGDTIIALIKMDAADASVAARYVQYFTTGKTANSCSIAYELSNVYTEVGSLTGDSNGVTFTGLYKLDTLPTKTVAANDKVIIQHTDASDVIKTVTASSIANLAAGTITALNNQTANRLVTIGATTTELDGEANLTFDGSTLALTGAQTITGDLTVDTSTLYVDSSGNEVGIGTTSPDRNLHVDNLDSTTNAVVPVFRLSERTSGTPANGLGVGMEFEVESSASNNEIGATINAVVADNTLGNEDFNLIFNTMIGGATANERLRIGQDAAGVPSCVFNENGDDVDFRVEGDTNANMIVVDAGNNRVGFGNGPLNTIDFHGNQGNRILDVTSGSSAGWEDCRYIAGNDAGAPINLTLPNPGVAGRTYTFKNVNLQPMVISCVPPASGSDNIRKMDASLGGATYGTTFQVASGQTATLVYEAASTNWVVFGHQDMV